MKKRDVPLTLEEGLELVGKLRDRGWCPWEPISDECVKAVALRPQVAHLRQRDQDGVFVVLVQRELASRFLTGRIAGRNWNRWSALWTVACAFVERDRHGWTGVLRNGVDWRLSDFCAWFAEVLKPSYERLRSAIPEAITGVPDGFEPGLTAARLLRETLSSEVDFAAMSLGLAMHTQATLRPSGSFLSVTADQANQFLEFCLKHKPDLLTVRDQRITLDPESIKEALDGPLGRPVRPGSTAPSLDHDPAVASTLAVVEAADASERVRMLLRRRAKSARPGSASSHVLAHFEELASGQLTYPALGARVGMTASALNEAFHVELAVVRRSMKVA